MADTEWLGRGKLFDHPSSEFWQYGVGAFSWWGVTDDDALPERPKLFILLPNQSDRRGYVPTLLHMFNDGRDWSNPGDKSLWNGSRERPTLTASVVSPTTNAVDYPDAAWHGFVVDGKLSDKHA